ncbi:MAG: secD [Nocardioidaceae bacterium]|nr:secD [Nocardioidaceae bacterium]
MAKKPANANKSLPRPGRVLGIFLAIVVGLFAILALVGVQSDSKDSVWSPRLGLDLQGGTRITLQADAKGGARVTSDKLSEARDIIDQRVNGTGITEAEVTTQGGNQIVIEIPGKQSQDIVDDISRTAQLRFRMVWGAPAATGTEKVTETPEELAAAVAKPDWAKLTLKQTIAAQTDGLATLPKAYADGTAALQKQADTFVCTPEGISAVNDVASDPIVTCDTKTGEVLMLSPAVIQGNELKSADFGYTTQDSQWGVNLALKGDGVKTFEDVTTALTPTQGRFAIVLDGEILSAPQSNAIIDNGESRITGSFTQVTSKALANSLKFGALPLTFKLNGSSFEGPTLAGTQLQAGLIAGLVGLILVILYSLAYYRGLGLVAIASLLVAGTVTYALVLLLGQGLGFTLTLPGIAGLIVAIGITADSFIVFFERIRDEVRDGRTLRLAVEKGWARARNTILAADAVSFLAALILYIFAIGVVRGFAFALGLTTIIDVFVVFFFTKPLVTLLARTKFFGQGHKWSGLDASHLGITGRSVSQSAKSPVHKDRDAGSDQAGSDQEEVSTR